VREQWLSHSLLLGSIKIGAKPLGRPAEQYTPAHYQGRRWAWVDPQKDGAANQQGIDNRTKSRSSIIREQGEDPETVWREIAQEDEMMKSLGIQPIEKQPVEPVEDDDDE
jgi:capsid protein